MGPKTRSLVETLTELHSLLRSVGETHWASWLEADLRRLGDGDFFGITHLLSAYGGMGSFNDLVLDPMNGHRVTAEDAARINAVLSALRDRAWTLADQISREAVS